MSLSNFIPSAIGFGGTLTVYLNGQTAAVWDARDNGGKTVPNSFYQFVMEVRTAEGGKVLLERDAFVSPNHGEAVGFAAVPNVGRPGDILRFSASFDGNPADSQSRVRIYTVAGELAQSLVPANGLAFWDLTNAGGQPVASGIYLAVLDGIDPTNGQKFNKIAKVLVTR
jgi:hypothetical protein